MLGRVTIPEVHPEPFSVPQLTLGEWLDLQWWDVANQRRRGLVETLPPDVLERAQELAATELLAEYVYRRLQKAQPTLTRAAFDEAFRTPDAVEDVAARLARADMEHRPDFGGALGKGATEAGTGDSAPKRWMPWRRTSPSSASPPGNP